MYRKCPVCKKLINNGERITVIKNAIADSTMPCGYTRIQLMDIVHSDCLDAVVKIRGGLNNEQVKKV